MVDIVAQHEVGGCLLEGGCVFGHIGLHRHQRCGQIRRQLAFFQLPDLPLHLTDIGCEGVAPFGVTCRQEAPVHHANQQDIGLEFARRLRERSIARGIDKLCRSIVTCSPSASSASLPGLNEIEILVYNNYGVLTCTSQNTILGYILGCGENGFVYPASCI